MCKIEVPGSAGCIFLFGSLLRNEKTKQDQSKRDQVCSLNDLSKMSLRMCIVTTAMGIVYKKISDKTSEKF